MVKKFLNHLILRIRANSDFMVLDVVDVYISNNVNFII